MSADQSSLRREAQATVASIRTRAGQIEKALRNYTADSFYQIEHALDSLKTSADDLQMAINNTSAESASGNGK